MKTSSWLIVLALLAGAGYLGYQRFFVGPFGMSESKPLGTYAKLHGHLAGALELKSMADPPKPAHSWYKPPPGTGLVQYDFVIEFVHGRPTTLSNETITLAVDSDGNVRGMSAEFVYHGNAVALKCPNKVGRFAVEYWTAMTGGKPRFGAGGSKNLAVVRNAAVTGQFQRYPDMEQGTMFINMK